jgi:alpha-beta hydrolase superfamily lysophospholipase
MSSPPASIGGPAQGLRSTFISSDGTPLQYKAWLPAQPVSRALVLLHRGHEHAERWQAMVPHLQLPETAIFAWEARGHGDSPGRRGHAPGFMTYVRDLETFVEHLSATHGIPRERMSVVAHSVGAVVAAAWVHDYAPPLQALILATPAFVVKLYVPGALAGTRLLLKVRPDATIKSYVRGTWLTRDPEEQRAYDADTSISKDISARILVDLFDTAKRVIADAAVMTPPLLLFSAGDDSVVENRAHEQFFLRYGGAPKEHLLLTEARHAIFHDLCRAEVGAAICRFIQAQPDGRAPSPEGDARGPTKYEYDSLRQPLPLLSPKRLSYALQALGMRTLGRASHGISIGLRTGFDSGESLDYVYRNEATGTSPLGKMIDRSYLEAVGWKGIRQRRELLRSALQTAAAAVRQEDLPKHVADIAGGGGRYLLDLLGSPEGEGFTATCRDRSESALALGRSTAESLGLSARIVHETGDAFDPASIGTIAPRPSIVVVSGLYELFPSNEPLRRSLGALYALLPPGGWLLYTCQPWHPQVEMIARVLPNREQKPWIMRRRSQGEMDALVSAAGFAKATQWVDDFGIFTVAAARKPHA